MLKQAILNDVLLWCHKSPQQTLTEQLQANIKLEQNVKSELVHEQDEIFYSGQAELKAEEGNFSLSGGAGLNLTQQ